MRCTVSLIVSKGLSNKSLCQRKICTYENRNFENVNEHFWNSCILDMPRVGIERNIFLSWFQSNQPIKSP
jgi:hypothetical protein